MDEQFSVKSKPPYNHDPADAEEKENQVKYKQACMTEAMKHFVMPVKEDLKMEVIYQRFRGRMDSANIIGGIADALNKIAYKDDIQLREIQYSELRGNEDGYSVRISSLGSTRASA